MLQEYLDVVILRDLVERHGISNTGPLRYLIRHLLNPRKIYAIDTGLVHACSRSVRADWGHLLENFVFLVLRRKNPKIEYYKTRKGREVDFLVTDNECKKSLVQVSAEIKAPLTRKRDLTALTEAMGECGLDRAQVVTLDQEEHLKTESGQVDILPAWLWTLSL